MKCLLLNYCSDCAGWSCAILQLQLSSSLVAAFYLVWKRLLTGSRFMGLVFFYLSGQNMPHNLNMLIVDSFSPECRNYHPKLEKQPSGPFAGLPQCGFAVGIQSSDSSGSITCSSVHGVG